jgi:leucyl/phenylalanyl-tRNA--protein transferase
VRRDTCFQAVVAQCARVPRPGQAGTWITPEMARAYTALHREGYAHSFEAFRDGRLAGGLYGVSLGAAFFGESMFSLESYASRAAFAELCRTAWGWGFQFIDGQVPNANLAGLGARVVGREDFLERLARALEEPTRRGTWTGEPGSGPDI